MHRQRSNMLLRRNRWSTTVTRPTSNNTNRIQAIRKDLPTLQRLRAALHMDTRVPMDRHLHTVARIRRNPSRASGQHNQQDSPQSPARIQ